MIKRFEYKVDKSSVLYGQKNAMLAKKVPSRICNKIIAIR